MNLFRQFIFAAFSRSVSFEVYSISIGGGSSCSILSSLLHISTKFYGQMFNWCKQLRILGFTRKRAVECLLLWCIRLFPSRGFEWQMYGGSSSSLIDDMQHNLLPNITRAKLGLKAR